MEEEAIFCLMACQSPCSYVMECGECGKKLCKTFAPGVVNDPKIIDYFQKEEVERNSKETYCGQIFLCRRSDGNYYECITENYYSWFGTPYCIECFPKLGKDLDKPSEEPQKLILKPKQQLTLF